MVNSYKSFRIAIDILLTGGKLGSSPYSFTTVLQSKNYSDTTFEGRGIPSGPGAEFGAWGDYDNDGKLDILLNEWENLGGIAKIYQQDKNRQDKYGDFTSITNTGLPNNVSSQTSWGDYNKDGRLDIALTTKDNSPSSGSFVKIYHNNTPDANTRPSAPQLLNTFNTSEGVVFNWRPGQSSASLDGKTLDSKTPDRGLSYNLRVWTTSNPNGSGDVKEYIVGPMSSDDGTRQVVQLGNVNQGNSNPNSGGYSWLLKPDYLIYSPYDPAYSDNRQKYNWSVQAIDSARAGSPFIEGTPFTAPDIKPTLTISATDPNAAEIAFKYPEEAQNPGKFTITRTGGSLVKPLDVSYKLDIFDNFSYTPIPGTAIPGIYEDYELFSDSDEPRQPSQPRRPLPVNLYGSNIITIPAGKRSVNIDVDVRDDIYVEGNEKVVK